MTNLSKLTIRDAAMVLDVQSGKDVFHVNDPHALVQASGYLKYVLGPAGQAVFFRGQSSYYPTLSPTLYRGCRSHSAQSRREGALRKVLADFRGTTRMLKSLPIEVVEPVLQHYGLRTSWIDLVDNIWIALWFACHRAKATGPLDKYLHFEKRLPRNEPAPERFAYIVMVAADQGGTNGTAGLWRGASTELVDLRIAAPSIFLRPHAQHAVLFRLKGGLVRRDVDYARAIVGVIRVTLDDALDWLGHGTLLGIHALFPPPTYDHGYGVLLQDWPKLGTNKKTLGTVAHIGA